MAFRPDKLVSAWLTGTLRTAGVAAAPALRSKEYFNHSDQRRSPASAAEERRTRYGNLNEGTKRGKLARGASISTPPVFTPLGFTSTPITVLGTRPTNSTAIFRNILRGRIQNGNFTYGFGGGRASVIA